MGKVYRGIGTGTVIGAKEVLVDGEPLKHVERHSPDGFNWGYAGSGPADLALSILTDLLGKEKAEKYYMKFKDDVIAGLRQESGWILKEETIRFWLDGVDNE